MACSTRGSSACTRAATGASDGAAVMQRVRRERDRFVGFVVADTEAIPEAQRLGGHARFTGPTTLMVDERVRVESRAVVVAAGSHPFVPPPFDAIRQHVLTSDEVFELPDLPAGRHAIGQVSFESQGRAHYRAPAKCVMRSGPLPSPSPRGRGEMDGGKRLSAAYRALIRPASPPVRRNP